jgi:hypothetical protein
MMHRVHWAAPAPTWIAAASHPSPLDRAAAIRRPRLLRFASDAFMQELAAILDDDPERLAEIEARAGETWREYPGAPALPAADDTLLATPVRRSLGARFTLTKQGQPKESAKLADAQKASRPAAAEPLVLKLFQSSHQRFYLVAASIVCRFPGLPDHFVDPSKQERAWFVVRRLIARDDASTTFVPAESEEHAFVTSDTGSTWVPVPAPAVAGAPPVLVRGEEKLPMFGSPFVGRDAVSRRLFTGLVPVSRREAYMGAPRGKPAPPVADEEKAESEAEQMGAFPEPVDSRVVILIDDVIGPWRTLQAQVKDLNDTILSAAGTARAAPDHLDEPPKVALQKRDQILYGSWLVLLDFAAYLHRYLPAVGDAIDAGSPAALTTDAERALYTKLTQVIYTTQNPTTTITLAQALNRFDEKYRTTLELGPTLLGDNTRAQLESLPRFAFGAIKWPPVDTTETRTKKFTEELTGPGPNAIKAAVEAALRERVPDASVPPPPAAAHAAIPANRTTRFVIRCVFERPRCGPIAPPIVSEPTEPFAMAAYFDPDAPARQVRIAMPIDTSPAGLRKFQKGASFLISDVFCGQLGAARKLTLGDLVLSVLPWPFHKDLPEPQVEPCQDGMVCSLSIPIVTICALIFLIIIAIVFNTFFFWLPFLIQCFPLKLKAKEQL